MMDIDPTKALQAAIRIGFDEAKAQAADEIEKLRAENKRLRAAFQKYFGQSEATNVRAALGEKE